jgi:predicted glycosyltransferase
MKILFFAAHYAYYRNFESAIVALAERGHQIHLAADERESLGGQALVERLAARYTGVTFGFAPSLDDEAWFLLARKLRTASDYIRFHDEAFAAFRKTRLTLRDRIPRMVLWLMDAGLEKSRSARSALASMLRATEAIMPISESSREFITQQDPDVILITSMTAWRLPQIDHLRAARALGKRTGVCVFSWDHLSSKALLRQVPDRVLLWNETQKQEAIRWHGMPEERIVVTGAQCYDQWFDRPASRDRVSFCRAVGLDPDRPLLLYVCSVMTPNPYESRFVQRWIEEIRRSSDARLREASILVRPHPERTEEWEGVSLERFGNAVLYGRNPVSPQAQHDYFDSLYHSHAVIGLVTSAFLEAAIVGRSVHTLLLPEFEMYQEGVQHFRYLMEVEGGLLKVTRTLSDHLSELSAVLGQPAGRDEQNARFMRAFVRPFGLEVPATPAFVEAVEQIGSNVPRTADVPGFAHQAVQPLVRILAHSAADGWLRPALRDASEMTIDHARARKAAHKQAAAEDRERRVEEKREFLATRRRERQRQHWRGARRKQLERIKGRLKDFVSFPS